MASKNEVTLTFAGDASKLEKAFDSVGQSAKTMGDDVGSASRRVADESEDAFGRTSAAADGTYNSFDGLEALGRGTTDTMSGLADIMAGNVLQGATDLTGGVAALASGFRDALLPALKVLVKTKISDVVQTTRQIAVNGAHRVATLASAAATNVMAVAQRALNLAMRANPIGIIITILFALGAAVVMAYKKSETFRNVVQAVWRGIKSAVSGTWEFLKKVFNWFRELPGKIRSAFSTLASAISSPFRNAFNGIRSFWNSTVGGFGFSIPNWVPIVGGKQFRIPYLHTGGVVPGAPGQEVLTMLEAGERVKSARGGGADTVIEIRSGGSRMDDLLVEILRRSIRKQGGNVQVALGG